MTQTQSGCLMIYIILSITSPHTKEHHIVIFSVFAEKTDLYFPNHKEGKEEDQRDQSEIEGRDQLPSHLLHNFEFFHT